MKGWKTYLGAGIIVISIALQMIGKKELAEAIWALGIALGVIGLRHKLGRMAVKGAISNVQEENDPVDQAMNH